MLQGPLVTMGAEKKIEGMGAAKLNKVDWAFIKELLETCKIVPVIDRRNPLNETAQAIRYLETYTPEAR